MYVHGRKTHFQGSSHLYHNVGNTSIASDKRGIHIIFFLFLNENICCGYSLEVPLGTSSEFPQHTFLLRNKK